MKNRSALHFVLIIGVANFFADFTYEGARGIVGEIGEEVCDTDNENKMQRRSIFHEPLIDAHLCPATVRLLHGRRIDESCRASVPDANE